MVGGWYGTAKETARFATGGRLGGIGATQTTLGLPNQGRSLVEPPGSVGWGDRQPAKQTAISNKVDSTKETKLKANGSKGCDLVAVGMGKIRL